MLELAVIGLSVTCLALCFVLNRTITLASVERETLLNRIQAPQAAVARSLGKTRADTPDYLPFDNDEAFEQMKADGHI